MKFIFRVIKFIKNYYRSPRFLFVYCLHFLSPSFKQDFKFFTLEEFRKEIFSGKSFIRIGDGETGIINGTGPLFYQKREKQLVEMLKEMVRNYRSSSPYILGLPQEFINESNHALRARDRFYCYYQAKVTTSILFPKDVWYGDTIMFYYGDTFFKIFIDYIADKKVFLVSKKETIQKWSKVSTPFSSITYFEGPEQDAFSVYGTLIKEIEKEIAKEKGVSIPVILFSLGPTSKALAYHFSQQGITCYDLGVGAEVLFQQKDYRERI